MGNKSLDPIGTFFKRTNPQLSICRLLHRKFRLVCMLIYPSKRASTMNIEVGSYEAKTKLPELLRGVQSGKCFSHWKPPTLSPS